MKRTIMTGKNGFVYRSINTRPLTPNQKKELRLEIVDTKRKINAEILKSGRMGFIK